MKFNFTKLTSIIILGIITVVSSCTSDLDVDTNVGQNILSEDAFLDEGIYQELLAGTYGSLALTGSDGAESSNLTGIDAGASQYGRMLLYLQDLSSDQMVWSYESNDAGTRGIQRTEWTPQNPFVLGFYERAFNLISYANNFLRETTVAKLDARDVSVPVRADIVTYRAEARLLRALAYYHIMDLYGRCGFVDETSPVSVSFRPEQILRPELFSYIEGELTAIENDLVAPMQNISGRADKALAWSILAKMYLNAEVYIGTEKYTECLTYLNKITGESYDLSSNYKEIFMADNDVNPNATKEIIFSVVSDGVNTQNYGPTTVMVNGSVGSIEENGASLGVGATGWGGAIRITKQFSQLFDGGAFNTDVRNSIIKADRNADIINVEDNDQGYVLTKWSNVNSNGTPGQDQTFVDTDFVMFRLADIHLMYAEAVVRGGSGGSLSQAVTYINDLRTRSNNPQMVTSSDLNLDFILDERARELYWEAHRRQDLIRFGKFTGGFYNWAWKGNGGVNGVSIPETRKLYPIPANSLAANPNLQQNTGY